MKVYLTLLCLCVVCSSCKEQEAPRTESKALFESLPELLQQGQIQVLSFAESLLEKSTDLVDDFYDLREKLENATNVRSDMKQRLRYIKQKARHMREDIEDEIEVQREKAAKAKAAEKKAAEEKIVKLSEARSKLRLIDRLSKRTKWSQPKSRTNSQTGLQRVGQRKEENKSTTTSTTVPSTKRRPIVPNVKVGLGDGFGRHT